MRCATAASSCASFPLNVATGSFATAMSGTTPLCSIIHLPPTYGPNEGIVNPLPSTSANSGLDEYPTAPPHVRAPTTFPKPSSCTPAAKISASDDVISSTNTATLPRNAYCMVVSPGPARCVLNIHATRLSRSRIHVSMFPPALRRTSMIKPALRMAG